MARMSAIKIMPLVLAVAALVLLAATAALQMGRDLDGVATPPTTPAPTAAMTNTPLSRLLAPFPPPALPTNTPTVTTQPEHPVEVTATATFQAVAVSTPIARSASYVIQRGDTLQGIASDYGLAAKTLQEINDIADPRRLQVGAKIIIPLGDEHEVSSPARVPTATVAPAHPRVPLAFDHLPATVHVIAAQPAAGEPYWRLITARWVPPDKALGRHHIYVALVDEEGHRLAGCEIIVRWAGGWTSIQTDTAKPEGEDVAFPQYGLLGSYTVEAGGLPSDKIVGLGLGTPDNPGNADHTCWYLVFQRSR